MATCAHAHALYLRVQYTSITAEWNGLSSEEQEQGVKEEEEEKEDEEEEEEGGGQMERKMYHPPPAMHAIIIQRTPLSSSSAQGRQSLPDNLPPSLPPSPPSRCSPTNSLFPSEAPPLDRRLCRAAIVFPGNRSRYDRFVDGEIAAFHMS